MPFQSQLHREVREAETMRRLLQIDFSNVYTNISYDLVPITYFSHFHSHSTDLHPSLTFDIPYIASI